MGGTTYQFRPYNSPGVSIRSQVMTRLERNRQQAILIVARIERNLELARYVRVGQLIRADQASKQSFQRLIRDFQQKESFHD